MSYCVFIPGIQGSELHQGEDNRLWPAITRKTIKQLFLNKEDIPMQTQKMLSVLGFGVYRDIDGILSAKFGANFTHFSFDWRFELDRHFDDLYHIVEGKRDIVFVAHSMGGLLTKLFIHWCNDNNKFLDIKKIITIGTPWQGAPESLYWLKYGDTFPRWLIMNKMPSVIGLNTADQMMKLSNTLPSVFHLLPHDDYIENTEPILYKSDGSGVSNAYSTLFNNVQYKMYQEFSQTIQTALAEQWPNNLGQVHHAIIGHKHSTFGGIVTEQSTKNGVIDKKEIKWTSGDGTVPVKSGTPRFSSQNYYIKGGHLKLTQSSRVHELITAIIDENNINAVSSRYFENEASNEFSGRNFRVACPVSVSIENEDGYLTGEINSVDNLEQLNNSMLDSDKTNMYRIEDSFFVFIDEEVLEGDFTNQDLNFEIKAYDKGLATVEVEKYSEGAVVQSKLFKGLEISPEAKAVLHVPSSQESIQEISLTKKQNGQSINIEGFTLNNEEINEIKNPITKWVIENEPSGEVEKNKVYSETEIKIKINDVSNINNEDILEYRYIMNGNLFYSRDSEFTVIAEEGMNKITVFTITKNGLVDKRPKTISFEVGIVKVITNKEIILTNEHVEVLFNQNFEKRDEIQKNTFSNFKVENDFKLTDSFEYYYEDEPVTVRFYTKDKFNNVGDTEELLLPNKMKRDVIFKSKNLSLKDLFFELGISNPFEWEVKINRRTVKSIDSKITEKSRKIELFSKNTKYVILLKEDYELFWEQGITEVITSNTKKLDFSFVIKRSSSSKKVSIKNLEDLKMKVYAKDNSENFIEIPIYYHQEEEVYAASLNVSKIPKKVNKGIIKVYYKGKPLRELKFTFE